MRHCRRKAGELENTAKERIKTVTERGKNAEKEKKTSNGIVRI